MFQVPRSSEGPVEDLEPDELPSHEGQKLCGRCLDWLPVDAFNRKTETLLQNVCKKCQSAYHKEWYGKDRKARVARVAARKATIRAQAKPLLTYFDFCQQCGVEGASPVPVRGEVAPSISKMVAGGYSIERITAALELCDALCPVCEEKVSKLDGNLDPKQQTPAA